jgi:hypothetical protein
MAAMIQHDAIEAGELLVEKRRRLLHQYQSANLSLILKDF